MIIWDNYKSRELVTELAPVARIAVRLLHDIYHLKTEITTRRSVLHKTYSYLITEMLAPFFASFLVMNAIFFLVKLIPFLNFALELNIGHSIISRAKLFSTASEFDGTTPLIQRCT